MLTNTIVFINILFRIRQIIDIVIQFYVSNYFMSKLNAAINGLVKIEKADYFNTLKDLTESEAENVNFKQAFIINRKK